MRQFSTDNSPVELEILSGHFLFADPLYFQNIIDNYSLIDTSDINNKRELVKVFEETIFPYGDGGLLGYQYVDNNSSTYLFDPTKLKKWDTEDEQQCALAQQKQITTFGVDTASFLIVDMENIEILARLLKYDTLVDAFLTKQLDEYFDQINNELGNKGWAYLVSGGVQTNTDFDGDGSYLVE